MLLRRQQGRRPAGAAGPELPGLPGLPAAPGGSNVSACHAPGYGSPDSPPLGGKGDAEGHLGGAGTGFRPLQFDSRSQLFCSGPRPRWLLGHEASRSQGVVPPMGLAVLVQIPGWGVAVGPWRPPTRTPDERGLLAWPGPRLVTSGQ